VVGRYVTPRCVGIFPWRTPCARRAITRRVLTAWTAVRPVPSASAVRTARTHPPRQRMQSPPKATPSLREAVGTECRCWSSPRCFSRIERLFSRFNENIFS
jgi:hypothetical protein